MLAYCIQAINVGGGEGGGGGGILLNTFDPVANLRWFMLMLVFVCRAPCIGSAFLFRISVVGVFHELASVQFLHFSWPSRSTKKFTDENLCDSDHACIVRVWGACHCCSIHPTRNSYQTVCSDGGEYVNWTIRQVVFTHLPYACCSSCERQMWTHHSCMSACCWKWGHLLKDECGNVCLPLWKVQYPWMLFHETVIM